MALAVFKMGPCKEGIEIRRVITVIGKKYQGSVQQQKGNEDGKDTRAIAEGPVETWESGSGEYNTVFPSQKKINRLKEK